MKIPFCYNVDGARTAYAIYQSNDLLRTADQQPIVTSPSPNRAVASSPVDGPIIILKTVSVSPGPSNPKSNDRGNVTKNTVADARTLLSPNSFNTINPSPDLKLPAEIFASDDSVSDVGIVATDEVQKALLQESLLGTTDSVVSTSKDKMLGGINIKVEKVADYKNNKKSKKTANKDASADYMNIADIKTELQDDLDWNNMTLATLNNNTNVNRYPTTM